jgi:hypothetical protein
MLDLTQAQFARLFESLGDSSTPAAIQRRVERCARGLSAVPGETEALLNVLVRFPVVLESLREPKPKRRKPHGRQ